MAHLFKGKDRQMLQKAIQCLNAIVARDDAIGGPHEALLRGLRGARSTSGR